jgi:hypothetical protein
MKKKWTALELKEYWTLSPQELDFIKSKSRKSRLAFSFLLKYFQMNMRFPARALTPLMHSHINPYGFFFLDMKQRLKGLPSMEAA